MEPVINTTTPAEIEIKPAINGPSPSPGFKTGNVPGTRLMLLGNIVLVLLAIELAWHGEEAMARIPKSSIKTTFMAWIWVK